MFTTKQSIDTTPPPSHTNNISFISLPSELLCQIFSHFDHNLKPSSSSYFPSSTFTNQKINLKTLHSCCLVNRHWCINAIPLLYSNTFSHYQFINTKKLIETYLKYIKYNEDGNRGEDGDDISSSPSSPSSSLSSLYDHSTSTPFNLSPSFSQATPSTLFNYPSYLKHLDYYGLIVSIKRFLSLRSLYNFDQSSNITCNDGVLSTPRSPTSVNDKALILELQQEKSKNYLIKRFLKLFYDNNSIITSLIIDTDDETTCSLSDEEYLLWYNNEDKNDRLLFKNLKNLIVKANFCQDNLFFKLKDVCKNLETLRINMSNFIAHNNNNNKKIESQNLAILISSQTNLKHFELYGFECFTELILPSLIYQSHSLQTLILEYLDFNDCNNDSLTSILNCRKLQVLKFIGCTNLKKETFECLEKSAANTSNSSNYWSELKDVCVTPNMCEEMRNWAKRIKNNNNSSNCNISRNNRSINRIIELSQNTNLIKSVK